MAQTGKSPPRPVHARPCPVPPSPSAIRSGSPCFSVINALPDQAVLADLGPVSGSWAPIPTSELSPMVQPLRMTLYRLVAVFPRTVSGQPGSVLDTQFSCTFTAFCPTRISSYRRAACSRTRQRPLLQASHSPMTFASGATMLSGVSRGVIVGQCVERIFSCSRILDCQCAHMIHQFRCLPLRPERRNLSAGDDRLQLCLCHCSGRLIDQHES